MAAGRRANRLIILGTAIIVLDSGTSIITTPGDDDNSVLIRGFSVDMVLVAWTILQLAYAERYAHHFLENSDSDPFDFPATPNPSLLEFAYFAFTIGTTFGTSDMAIQSTRLRGIVLGHGLLAFVYNTAILGIVISLLSG